MSGAQAQSVWGGTGSTTSTTDYNLDTNWSNPPAGAPPVSTGQSALFASTGSATVDITAGPITPDSWTFTGASQGYTVSGQAVNFNGAGPNLINAGGTNSISNNMTASAPTGQVQVTGGSLTLSGTNVFSFFASISGGTFTNSGTFSGGVGNGANGTYHNTGTVNGGLSNSGIATNSGTQNGGVTNSGTYTQTAGSTNGGLANTGTVNLDGGAFNGAISNLTNGVVNIGGTVTSDNTFSNNLAARLLVNSGTYTVTGKITNSGTNAGGGVLVALGATLNANAFGVGGFTNNAGATFINNGTTAVSGGFLNNGTSTNTGTLNGGLANTATYTQTAGSTNGGTLNSAGTINANGGAFNGGVDNIGTFNVGGTVTSDSTFHNLTPTSRLLVNSGSYTVTGSIQNFGSNASGGILVSSGASLTANGGLSNAFGATFTNVGTTAVTGGLNNVGTGTNTGTLNGGLNNNFGVYTQFSGATNGGTTNTGSVTAAGGAFNGAIQNNGAGTFNVGGIVTSDNTFTNNGTAQLSVTSGSYSIAGTVTNNSTSVAALSVASGTTLSALSIVNNAGFFANNGTVSGTTTNNGGTVNNNGAMAGVVNTSGTFNNNNGSSITTLNNNGGTFANATGATVSGAATISAGTVTNTGTFSSTLGLTGGTFINNGSVAGTTTNNGGTVNNNAVMAGVVNTSGTFNNVNFGSITTLNNSGGAFANLSGALVMGVATISAGSVTNAGGFLNTLSLTGGSFTNNIGGYLAGGATTNNGGTVTNNGGSFAAVTNISGTFNNAAGTAGAVFNAGTGSNGGTISFLVNTAGTFTNSGHISGPMTVSGGTVLVTGGGSVSGATNVTSGGVLNVAGSIASTTVGAGGILEGTGIVGATTIQSNGTLIAGNGTPGTSITLASLAMQSAAIYVVNVNPTTSAFASVTGTATLGGATVSTSFASGTYVAKQYTILTAGSVSGTFDPTVVNGNLPSGFKTSLSYDATHAYLDLALSFAPPSGNLNGNQQNVGNAIGNFFNSTGSIPIVFGGLTPAGLTQLSGEVGSAPQQTTFNAMTQFMGLMTDPFVDGRGDPLSAGGAPNAYAQESLAYAGRANGRSKNERDAYAAVYTKAPVAPPFEQRWSVWAAGFGGSQATDGNAVVGSNNTTSSLYGAAVGADYRISRDTLVGFAIAGGGTNFTVANALGGGRSDLFQAGVFLRHNIGPAYIAGALAYGWQDVTTDRTVTVAGLDRLRAEFNANAYSGRLEGGYRFVAQGFGWTPYAAAQFTTFDLPAYAEQAIVGSNQFALAYAAKSVTDPRTELGLRTDKSFAQADGILTLRGRLAWAHDYNANRSVGATFQALPGASFVVNGAAQAADSALVTAAVEKKWLSGWSAATTFEGEFSNVTRSYAGKGVVRYQW